MNNIRTQFRAPWDYLLIIITSIIVIGLLALNYFFNQSLIPTIITWVIILGTATYGVYGYSIQDNSLRILRLGWSKDIQLSEIKTIEYKPNAMMGSLRTWGIGGVFGYIGYFKNKILNNYKAYATHRRKTVVITTKSNEQIVVTPDNPEVFVASLEECVRTHMNEGILQAT